MASFGVSLDTIEWVITAYMLAMAVMLPTSNWLADRFGYKLVYFCGLLIFTLGSFLCGMATDETFLILARVLQGLGAGCLMPVGMAIITREFPTKQRGLALGFWSISAAASVSFGPLIGGYLVDNFNWPLIFDVNVPVGAFGLLVTLLVQREYKNPNARSFDLVGFTMSIIFLPCILYALSQGNASTNSEGWSNPTILLLFAISAISLTIFIVNELNVEHPMIDLRLLKDSNFGLSNLIIFLFGMGMFGSTFLLPMYLQNSMGYTALQSGSVFLPVGILQGTMAPLSGIFSDRINPRVPIILGILLLALSFWINGFLSYLSERPYIMTSLFIRGFAMGILFTPLNSLALVNVKREKMGQASGLMNVIRQLGGSFGVAIFSTILTSRIIFHMVNYGQNIEQNSPLYQNISKTMAQYAIHSSYVSQQAYIEGIDDDFKVACLITFFCGIPIFFLKRKTKEPEKGMGKPVQLTQGK
jgi:DHA2 family multidrug resistance protein